MSAKSKHTKRMLATVFNLPNQLTTLRLLLAVILFCFIGLRWYATSFVFFIIAAGTDWLDGYFARKYGQVTTLGRILDPFADKVIICGTFICLLTATLPGQGVPGQSVPAMLAVRFGLRAWMVVVIVGRELLVTALRSFLEQQGSDFSAKMPGKLKMLLQCISAGAGLFYLLYLSHYAPAGTVPPWIYWTLVTSTWAAVVLTVYSGVVYVFVALRLLRA